MKNIEIGGIDAGVSTVVDLFADAQDEVVAMAWEEELQERMHPYESVNRIGTLTCGKCMQCDENYLYT